MDYNKLDQISMVLMLALAEYLVKTSTPMYTLFESVMYKDKNSDLDLIKAKDFFSVMNNIGIQTEGEQHENLKEFYV